MTVRAASADHAHYIQSMKHASMLVNRQWYNMLSTSSCRCSASKMTAKQMKLEESGIVTEKAANDDGKRPGAHLKGHTSFFHVIHLPTASPLHPAHVQPKIQRRRRELRNSTLKRRQRQRQAARQQPLRSMLTSRSH